MPKDEKKEVKEVKKEEKKPTGKYGQPEGARFGDKDSEKKYGKK